LLANRLCIEGNLADRVSPFHRQRLLTGHRLASEMAERFNGTTKEFAEVPAFTIAVRRGIASPWVLVGHPLWDWTEDGPPPKSLFASAFEQASAEGSAAAMCWDTFNLARRQVMVRERIRETILQSSSRL